MARRKWLIGVGILTLLLVGAGAIWWRMGRSGAGGTEDWIRRYLQSAVQAHLNAHVDLGQLDYRYPRTVVLSNIRLTEAGTTILAINQARLELAEIPHRNQPVIIERVELGSPSVKLVLGPTGDLVGWSNIVKADAAKNRGSVEPGMHLSDFLRIRHSAIDHGSVEYIPGDGGAPMTLGDIHSELNATPAPDAPGAYQITANLKRDQLADVQLDGRVNVDSGEFTMEPLRVRVSLDSERYRLFPPSIQRLLREHQIQGDLTFESRGALPLGKIGQRSLKLVADLKNARFATQGRLISAERLRAESQLTGDDLAARLAGDALGGSIEATTRFQGGGQHSIEFKCGLHRLELAQLATLLPETLLSRIVQYRLAGRISGSGQGSVTNQSAGQWKLTASAAVEPFTFFLLGRAGRCDELKLNAEVGGDQTTARLSTPRMILENQPQSLSAQDLVVEVTKSGAGVELRLGSGVLGGRIQGVARFIPDSPNQLDVDMRAERISAEALDAILPPTIRDQLPLRAKGTISGQIGGKCDTSDWRSSDLRGTVEFADAKLSLQADPLDFRSFGADGSLRNKAIELHLRMGGDGGVATANIRYALDNNPKTTVSGDLNSISIAPFIAHYAQGTLRRSAQARALGGRVSGTFRAAVPSDWRDAEFHADLNAADAYWVVAKTRLPLENARLRFDMDDRKINATASTNALDGSVNAKASFELNDVGPLRVEWALSDIRIEKIYELVPGSGPSQPAGRLKCEGMLTAQLVDWPASLRGQGLVDVDNGRLMNSPMLSDLTRLVDPRIPLLKTQGQDRARVRFTLRPARVEIQNFDVSCAMLSIRGEGDIFYDQRLALKLRTSLQPGLESTLGPVGTFLASLGDRLVEIKVDGTIQAPIVALAPVGSHANISR